MIKKIILSALIIIVALISFTSCFCLEDKKQTVYHEGYEDLEKYVLDELGDFVRFDIPQVSTSNSPIKDTKQLSLRVVFLSEYLNNKTDFEITKPMEVAEKTRELINLFISDHPDFYDQTTRIHVLFVIPPSGPYKNLVMTTNYDYETKTYSNRLSTIIPFEDDMQCYYDKPDIDIMDMCNYEWTVDQIIEVADNMPQLKYILVKDQETAEKVSNLRPDMKFYYVSEEYYKSQD